jgi:soluble lytic murein transglycosylase-like protein
MRARYLLATTALALVLQSPGALAAAPTQAGSDPAVHPYAPHVADAARRFGIPEAWIWAVMHVESRGDARAISPAGAMGLMQIMPDTWALLRARHGLDTDPFDVRDNILAGAAYLRAMFDRYGDSAAMLAAYHAGPGRYDDYRLRGRPLPAATLAYVGQLASIVGGTGEVQLAAAPPPDPFAWRRAALFARTADAPAEASSGPSNDTANVSPPTSDMLFVRVASAARPQ